MTSTITKTGIKKGDTVRIKGEKELARVEHVTSTVIDVRFTGKTYECGYPVEWCEKVNQA